MRRNFFFNFFFPPAPREVSRIPFHFFSPSVLLTHRCGCVCVAVCVYSATTILSETTLPSSVSFRTFIHPPFSSFHHAKQKNGARFLPSCLPFSVQRILLNHIFFLHRTSLCAVLAPPQSNHCRCTRGRL